MITFFILIILIYCTTFLFIGIYSFKVNTVSYNFDASIGFSILIPFRNEDETLINLLQSISKIDYDLDKFEVILIDDNDSIFFVNTKDYSFKIKKIKNIRTTNAPKKDALTLGVLAATFDFVLTVDADCEVPKNWLLYYNNYLLENMDKELVIGQVAIKSNTNVLQIFQSLELNVLQSITLGSYAVNQSFMCNGANLCFSKRIFNKVNGYHGNTDITSGDDVFLLQKINQLNPNLVGYCKSKEIVLTNAVSTWKHLWKQRLRWASKTKAYTSFFAKYLAILLFFTQLLSFFGWMYIAFINWDIIVFSLLILKYLVQLFLLFSIQKFTFKTLIFSFLFEFYYIIFCLLISFANIFNFKVKWK